MQQDLLQKVRQIQRVRQKSTEQKLLRSDSAAKPDSPRHPLEQALARAEQATQRDLLQALDVLQRENSQLRAQLRVDHLTGVFNRLALLDELECERLRWLRSGRCAALLLIDLNDFKQINDNHGHTIGDRALICVADYFAAQLRATDLVARLGGDEFAILLRDTDRAEAQRVANKLCANAPQLALAVVGASLQLKFAVGVADLTARFSTVQAWLDAADQAMYRHKRSGHLQLCRE